MKITKNFVDGQTHFCDVRPGQIFTTDDHMIFMKIREIGSEEDSIINAIYMEDGDIAAFPEDEKVKIIEDAELILNVGI